MTAILKVGVAEGHYQTKFKSENYKGWKIHVYRMMNLKIVAELSGDKVSDYDPPVLYFAIGNSRRDTVNKIKKLVDRIEK
jgi:hypothetical protein